MEEFDINDDIEYRKNKRNKQLPLPFDQAFSYEELYDKMLECRKGVSWKGSTQAFLLNANSNISKMEQELLEGTYKFSKPTYFKVWSPKERDIVACNFKDRIVQRVFCDNIAYPKMTKDLIYSNVACQKGKGTDCGRNLLKKYMYRAYKKWETDFYCLQIDIKGYYPHMNHEYINSLFREKLDDREYDLYLKIMDFFYPGEIGYNPGSQLVQIAGICGLNKLDHYCKEKKHCKYYIRYMDDIVILHNDKSFLESLLEDIKRELSKIGFEPNQKKTRIYPQSHNVEFLGFKWRINASGKILIRVKANSFKRAKKHWKGMKETIKHKKVSITYKDVQTSVESYRSYISRANCNDKILKIIEKEITQCQQLLETKNPSENKLKKETCMLM